MLNSSQVVGTYFRGRRVSGANEFSKCAATAEHHLYDRVSKNVGQVTKLANGVMYFPGTQQITNPSVAAVISANGFNGNFTN